MLKCVMKGFELKKMTLNIRSALLLSKVKESILEAGLGSGSSAEQPTAGGWRNVAEQQRAS